MERNKKIGAIVLKKINIGESNIGLTLLTEEDEVIFAMAFGASKVKSKLFGAANMFVKGSWDLYYDPVKDHWRVKEAFINDFHEDINQSIESFYIASLFCEIILKSRGSEGVYKLLETGLELLKEGVNKDYLIIQFILRFLSSQGVLSSFDSCSNCGREVVKESLYYSGGDELFCYNCRGKGRSLEIYPGVCIYCSRTLLKDFPHSIRIALDKNSLSVLKQFVLLLIRKHTEGKLLTLDSCDGLI